MSEQKEERIKKEKRKGRKSRFWFGYRIYLAVLALLIVIMCFAVWKTMKKYEAAQPERVVEKVIGRLEKGDLSGINYIVKGNKFEKDIDMSGRFEEMAKNKTLTYKQASGSYDSLAPSYDILSGEEKIAKISLRSVKEYKKMAILVLSEWEITSIEPYIETGSYDVKITVPANFKVEINNTELGSEEKKDEAEAQDFKFVKEYVDVPGYATYEVKGLMNIPELTVNGRVIASDEITDNNGKLIYETGYESKEISSELSDYVLNAAKTYSNFFTKDVEGCNASVAPIAPFFPENSYYLELAENYRQHDMWMYSAHEPAVFSNEQVTDYTEYGDKCFSVKVMFDKSMKLTLNGEVKVDHNDQIYYYVKIGDKWVIADIHENV